MSSHDKNLLLVTALATSMVTVNFFAVITGNADALYAPINDMLQALMMARGF